MKDAETVGDTVPTKSGPGTKRIKCSKDGSTLVGHQNARSDLEDVRLGEGQLVAALPVDRSGSDHKKARGKWMLRWQRRGLWRAQPSRTPSQRLGAQRRAERG